MAPGADIDVIELEMQKTLAVRAAHRLKHPDSRKYYQGSGDNEEENVKQGHGTVLSRMHECGAESPKNALAKISKFQTHRQFFKIYTHEYKNIRFFSKKRLR